VPRRGSATSCRRRRARFGVSARLGHDDLFTFLDLALNDLAHRVVIESRRHGNRDRLPVAQDEDLRGVRLGSTTAAPFSLPAPGTASDASGAAANPAQSQQAAGW